MKMLKKAQSLLLFIVVLFVFGLSCDKREIIVFEISGEELVKVNSAEKKHHILILDTRSYEQYLKGHIKNAVSMPTNELEKRIKEIIHYKNKAVYVCNTSYEQNIKALNILAQNDFSKLYSAEGVGQFRYAFEFHQSVTAPTFLALAKKKGARLIDYRFQSAFNAGHLPSAMHIEYGTVNQHIEGGTTHFVNKKQMSARNQSNNETEFFEESVEKLSKETVLLFYSNMGTTASEGAEQLTLAGYPSVYACIDGVSMYPFDLVSE